MSTTVEFKRCVFTVSLSQAAQDELREYSIYPHRIANPTFQFVETGDSRTFDDNGRIARNWHFAGCSGDRDHLIAEDVRSGISEAIGGMYTLNGRRTSASGYSRHVEKAVKGAVAISAAELPVHTFLKSHTLRGYSTASQACDELQNYRCLYQAEKKALAKIDQDPHTAALGRHLWGKTLRIARLSQWGFGNAQHVAYPVVVDLRECDSLTRELTVAWLCQQQVMKMFAHNWQGEVTALCNRIMRARQDVAAA